MLQLRSAAALSVIISLCLGPHRVEAQSRSDSAIKERVWATALGLGLTELSLGTERPGTRAELFASLTRTWPLSHQFELRAQGIASVAFPRALVLNEQNGCPGCEVWTSREMVGITGALAREWRKGKSLRPYVTGGIGAYYTHSRRYFEGPPIPEYWLPYVPQPYQLGLGYNIGAGTSFRFRALDMFLDFSLHDAPLPAAGFSAFAPLSVGVRF